MQPATLFLKYVLQIADLREVSHPQGEASNACTTILRGEAGNYGKGIGVKTKQKPTCIQKNWNALHRRWPSISMMRGFTTTSH
jgi:hypothetical protein